MNKKVKTKLKIGDFVEIIAGKEKGKRGKLIRLLLKKGRGVVEGANLAKKHTKATQTTQGGIITKEGSIHLSSIMAVDAKTDRATRIGKTHRREERSKTYVCSSDQDLR